MSKIKILSENLANQIAAGEVVERPASVVKELVENAIDAGATQISIQVEGGGARLIRVIDDGEGMDQDDVLLSLERHATSKIAHIDQLSAIRSLGFRGEALPSISSVSRLTITSRQASAALGCKVEVKFGKIIKVHDMGCRPGTVMEVRNLFGNVPARKKFLKTTHTELAHIYDIVKNYAIACYGLGFHYAVDDRVILDVPAASDSLQDRIGKLFGGFDAESLIAVNNQETSRGQGTCRVYGYLLPPEYGVGGSSKLKTYVNGRAVRDRMLNHAVLEGLQGYLMKGKRPAGAVFVEINPEFVDVNVHPTKQEVKFQRPAAVHDQILAALRMGLTE